MLEMIWALTRAPSCLEPLNIFNLCKAPRFYPWAFTRAPPFRNITTWGLLEVDVKRRHRIPLAYQNLAQSRDPVRRHVLTSKPHQLLEAAHP